MSGRRGRQNAVYLALFAAGLLFGLVAVVASTNGTETVDSERPHERVVGQVARDEPRPVPAGLDVCKVIGVVDGDTIDLGCDDPANDGRVRLILVDTPEVFGGAECFGKQASDYTKAHLFGRNVELERDVSNTDAFGRFLRYVWADGELFNERLVLDGYAVKAEFPPDLRYRGIIETAEILAKEGQKGLWPVCGGDDLPATPTPPGEGTPVATSTPIPTATATATATSGACGGGTATITALDKVGETVTISGSGNLTGWYLISEAGNQRFDFQAGFVASGTVTIRSNIAQFPNTANNLWWTAASVWNNGSDDDAYLYNCLGQQVSYFDDGI